MNINEIVSFLSELKGTSGTNAKIAVLKSYQNSEEIKNYLKHVYDKVSYVYGVSYKAAMKHDESVSVSDIDGLLEDLSSRRLTGNAAKAVVKGCLEYSKEHHDVLKTILEHDIDAGIQTKNINKVWKGLIPKPNYCRCDVFSAKNASKIDFPCYIQLKCDGTYREARVQDGKVEFKTRSGESYENPVLAEEMKTLPDGYYTGELTIGQADKPSANRSEGNGAINSDDQPVSDIIFTVWDYLSDDEYACLKISDYETRFETLKNISLPPHMALVPCFEVSDASEALEKTSEWMSQGLEGGVLKSKKMQFKNGTSKLQLKIKLKVDCEMRIVGFTEGTGKRAGKIGAIKFKNDEGTIEGQCSGFSDAQLDEFTASKEKYLGKIISVEFNDLSKAEGSLTYALSHPRFVEIRNDKNETDTLEKVIKLRDMAKTL